MRQRKLALALLVLAPLVASACGQDSAQESRKDRSNAPDIVTPQELAGLSLSAPRVIARDGATNPTTAYDPDSGTLYMAWARETGGSDEDGDPLLEAVVARSAHRGATFSDPVVVSVESVYTREVSPTQVVVGPRGTVYVLYQHAVPSELSGDRGLRSLRVVRSDDGGRTFSAPVVVAGQDAEGVLTSMDMATLFAAPDGDVYVSFLDARENIEDKMKAKPAPEHGGHGMEAGPGPENQLRVVRSTDGGVTWARSVLVARATCVCCGTMIAQGADSPLYAGTRSEWKELKDSKDAVRDPYLSVSRGKVSFSKTWQGTIPSISTGEDWAAVAWQAVEKDEAKPTSLSLLVARPGK